jgi:hypothetical protein
MRVLVALLAVLTGSSRLAAQDSSQVSSVSRPTSTDSVGFDASRTPGLGIITPRSANLRPSGVASSSPTPRYDSSGRLFVESPRRRHWPLYALGGAVLGGGGITLYAVANCDLGCRDDGALGFLPPYIAVAAALGAIVGAVIGLTIDAR